MPQNLLSIIVPVLNEETILEDFLDNLAGQEHIDFEVILGDGGSDDQTVQIARAKQAAVPFELKLVTSAPGRGRQLNAAARAAAGDWLLFVHADSRFVSSRALMLAVASLRREMDVEPRRPCAGHFQLRFRTQEQKPVFGYFFYEAKSRLDYPDCIHGDQGFLMPRVLFERLGGYPEALPFLEDSALADAVAEAGRWVSLPAEISTSARRFETEGLRARQTLNALILNFRHIGWEDFFAALPEAYRTQDRAGRLDLFPFWLKIKELLARLSLRRRQDLWLATGAYVRSQAWQLVYARHCYTQFRHGQSAIMTRSEIEEKMRSFNRITDNPPGRLLTALLVWSWFHLTHLVLLHRYRRRVKDKGLTASRR